MKSLYAVVVGLVVLSVAPVRAQDESPAAPRFTRATIEQSVQTLVDATKDCTNPCMLISAARTMQQLKELYPERSFSAFVIPLMRIVKDENLEACPRIVAAIALHNLDSGMGDFAIQRTAQFTSSERVKHICTWLTYYRQHTETEPALQDNLALGNYQVEPLMESIE